MWETATTSMASLRDMACTGRNSIDEMIVEKTNQRIIMMTNGTTIDVIMNERNLEADTMINVTKEALTIIV